MTTVHRNRGEFSGCTIADAITSRGKELTLGDTVEAARRLFDNPAVQVAPVLDGQSYVGSIPRGAIGDDTPAGASIGPFVSTLVPTATAGTPAEKALAALDDDGSTRLVVLDDDGGYVGLVCLRSDRVRLCVDAGRSPDTPLPEGHPR